jgi:hypothetical protein
MKLTEDEALQRLTSHDHGVLCTLHAERGIDAVPVVYATDSAGFLGVPVDLVKQKSSLRLQRETNLEADGRATLLAEYWNRDDWSKLWWVRAELRWLGDDVGDQQASLGNALAHKYPQYRHQPFAKVLVFTIVGVSGWSGS